MTTAIQGWPVPFVRRVRIKNYRSIAACHVSLSALTVLLGFNASGKSNFLDAIRFIADALTTSPELAISDRGGIDALLYRSPSGLAESFEIHLDLVLADDEYGSDTATYGIEIGGSPDSELPLLVLGEQCRVKGRNSLPLVLAMPGEHPTSRLRLPAEAARVREYALVDSALRSMRFYELDSSVLRAVDDTTARGTYLGSTGDHLGHVLGALQRDDPTGKERLDAYLSALVPNALGVDERLESRYSTVEARFGAGQDDNVVVFPRETLSEGTLRAAGVLAALFQPPAFAGRISLIGIEQPETALHPATVGTLYEALDDASLTTQVIVTSQSSDLLASEYARLDHIRAVANVDGVTYVGEVDASGHAAIDKQIMTISELHRSGQLMPARPERPNTEP